MSLKERKLRFLKERRILRLEAEGSYLKAESRSSRATGPVLKPAYRRSSSAAIGFCP